MVHQTKDSYWRYPDPQREKRSPGMMATSQFAYIEDHSPPQIKTVFWIIYDWDVPCNSGTCTVRNSQVGFVRLEVALICILTNSLRPKSLRAKHRESTPVPM